MRFSQEPEPALFALGEPETIDEEIMRLRFGIGPHGQDTGTHTLEEVGQLMGLTRERIRQIEEQALRTLQLPARRLREYLE